MNQYAKRLGNLVLMLAKDNWNVRSATFHEKREVYRRSPYVLTSEVADYDEWTPTTIVERQERLAELAVKAWPTI